MVSAKQPIEEYDQLDVRAVRKRFLAINRERLRRTEEALRWRTRDFLDLLPLIFHVNHAMLPGFVSKSTPAGISAWTVTKKSMDAGKRIAKSFDYKKRALRTFDIHSIFLMGSVGTIAHSERSDFDVWICHRPGLTEAERNSLQEKCSGIEEWAETMGMEVHFFLMDAEKFRKGQVVELSSESSGSTQHHLLLEEFYRTGLLVAGRYPVWWLVPPDEEVNYTAYVDRLLTNRFIPENEVIDFGGLAEIPAEEFFGAALWQVYKGIDSPYKSVLKMLLMEAYAAEYPYSDLLSMRYKKAIYRGITDLDLLDPYTILLEKLENYLSERNEAERLELVYRCFYFKTDLPLSKPGKVVKNWRYERMLELTRLWMWTEGQIEMLDDRSRWNVHRVLKERRILVDEITHSYMALSKFARTHASLALIEQKDLNILGRKLYAAFERKAGKIDTINRGIAANIVESQITIAHNRGQEDETTWSLHPGAMDSADMGKPLKRTRSVIELLAWCHFNRLVDQRTIVSLVENHGNITLKEIRSLQGTLSHLFPDGQLNKTQIESFANSPRIETACVFANVGIDPMLQHTRRGTDLVSEQSDIMNYSGFSLNLAQTFDLLVVTSWQEVIVYKYTGIDGLLTCLGQYLRWNGADDLPQPPMMKCFSYSSSHSIAVAKRLEQMFEDIASAYFAGGVMRYILQVQQSYYLIEAGKGGLDYSCNETYQELLDALGKPQTESSVITVDRHALKNTPLPSLLERNKKGCIQMFYHPVGTNVDIFVLDENGSLFHQRASYFDDESLLNHFCRFFDAILTRHNILFQDDRAAIMLHSLEIHKIMERRNGKYQFDSQSKNMDGIGRYFSVKVIADVIDKNTAFTIYCNNEEFSSLELGRDLFKEVASYVLRERSSGQRYPIYITDVDLSPSLLGERGAEGVQVIDYLKYKKRIETKLNDELSRL